VLKSTFKTGWDSARTHEAEDPRAREQQVTRPIALAIDRLERQERFRLTVVAATLLAILLGGAMTIILSWRVRRWLRILAGRRWILGIGECEFEARVTASAEGLRAALRRASESQSNTLEQVLPRHATTPGMAQRSDFESFLAPQAKVR
jgi:hypothetical protein